jgi:chorismate lyase / 3-hydroxybenzoate synthase
MTVAEKVRPDALSFEIEFGSAAATPFQRDSRAGLFLPLPRLAGERAERIFESVSAVGEAHGFQLYASGGMLIGCSVEPEAAGMETAAASLYRRLLAAAGGRFLYRIWNYVPEINQKKNGRENYRAFNAGRSRVFEEAFGPGYRQLLPAGSAVGCEGGMLAAVFAAGRSFGRQVENPEQVPAYEYPPEHGPRPPSFCRAVSVEIERRSFVFISGTAAIKGHRTVAPGEIGAQIDCTLDNLRLISSAAGVGDDLGPPGQFARHFKVYLRDPTDLPRVKRALQDRLIRPPDRVVWLEAALCRANLSIEIETTLVGAREAR